MGYNCNKNNEWLGCELENLYDIISESQSGGGGGQNVPSYLKPMSPLKKLVLKTMYKISPERTKKFLKIKIKTPIPSPILKPNPTPAPSLGS